MIIAGTFPLHLLEDTHGEQDCLTLQRTGADEHGVGRQTVLARELLDLGLEALAHVQKLRPNVLGLLDEQIELGGGDAGLGGGGHDGALGHALVAHHVPFGGVNKIHFQVLVAELVHEVLELHELVPGSGDAHQEHDVVGHAVGDLGHLLARFDGRLAAGEVALLVEVCILDLLGLPH